MQYINIQLQIHRIMHIECIPKRFRLWCIRINLAQNQSGTESIWYIRGEGNKHNVITGSLCVVRHE
jgi:hypothetical protein